eukprot:1946429-Pleurochrysis_carterae.AAC.1
MSAAASNHLGGCARRRACSFGRLSLSRAASTSAAPFDGAHTRMNGESWVSRACAVQNMKEIMLDSSSASRFGWGIFFEHANACMFGCAGTFGAHAGHAVLTRYPPWPTYRIYYLAGLLISPVLSQFTCVLA